MLFNSITFLVFFVLVFYIYWYLNNKHSIRIRNAFLVIASYVFYGYWDYRFLGLIVLSSLTDYVVANQLEKGRMSRKLLLGISVFVNLGILAFFKYFNFFIASVADIFTTFGVEPQWHTLNIVLPVGISFYTFQTLGYTIDVYRDKVKATSNIWAFFAYVSFFPQMVAGPIERAKNFLPQFLSKKIFNYNKTVSGLRLILFGLFKKLVIADNLGLLVGDLLAVNETYSGVSVLLGTFLFGIQIYTDFSGYCDIAIGLAMMLGFSLSKNFITPYFSASFGEFWTRWHITLSQWFRDYVYIPLGGNRKGNVKMYLFIMITFLVSGLWHGANYTFIIWGGLHGLLLVFEKRFKLKQSLLYSIAVFALVMLLWLPFRAESFGHFRDMTYALVDISSYSLIGIKEAVHAFSLQKFGLLIVVGIVFLTIELSMKKLDFNQWIAGKKSWQKVTVYYILAIAILLLINLDIQPDYIYFQF